MSRHTILASFLLFLLPYSAVAYGQPSTPDSCSNAEMDAYKSKIRQSILAHWRGRPADQATGCVVVIAQNFRGEILNIDIDECVDDVSLLKAIEDAAYLSSPLALPINNQCFERTIRVRLT